MSNYRLFNAAEHSSGIRREIDDSLKTSRHITATAVKFFVPSTAADLTDDADISVVAEAIYKVGSSITRHL
jgi:hypothetical protein